MIKKSLFSTKTFLVVSILMMVIGLVLDVMAWAKVIAAAEPPLVVHLSTFALIFSGYGNVITAMVNKQVKGD